MNKTIKLNFGRILGNLSLIGAVGFLVGGGLVMFGFFEPNFKSVASIAFFGVSVALSANVAANR